MWTTILCTVIIIAFILFCTSSIVHQLEELSKKIIGNVDSYMREERNRSVSIMNQKGEEITQAIENYKIFVTDNLLSELNAQVKPYSQALEKESKSIRTIMKKQEDHTKRLSTLVSEIQRKHTSSLKSIQSEYKKQLVALDKELSEAIKLSGRLKSQSVKKSNEIAKLKAEIQEYKEPNQALAKYKKENSQLKNDLHSALNTISKNRSNYATLTADYSELQEVKGKVYTERQLRIADAERYRMAISLIREMKMQGMKDLPDIQLPEIPPLEFDK